MKNTTLHYNNDMILMSSLGIEVPSKSLKTKQALLSECSIENSNTKCKESTSYSDILNKAIGSMNSI